MEVTMTLEELETIINEMKKENVESVNLDFSNNDCYVKEFDAYIWKNG